MSSLITRVREGWQSNFFYVMPFAGILGFYILYLGVDLFSHRGSLVLCGLYFGACVFINLVGGFGLPSVGRYLLLPIQKLWGKFYFSFWG